MREDKIYRKFYLAALSATGFFLPLSIWMLTFFIIALVIVWIADGGIGRIPQLIQKKWNVLIFCIIYFVYLIWMLNTSDLLYGLLELKIKLPLLIFPLVIGFSDPLNQKELRTIVSFFIAGVVISSVTGVVLKINTVMSGLSDSREISVFISHIRLALMAVLAIFCSGWYFFSITEKKRLWHFLYLAAAIWLTPFLFLLLSFTGILMFAVVAFLSVVWIAFSRKSSFIKYSLIAIFMALFVSATLFVNQEIKSFYTDGKAYPFPTEQFTANGNRYQHFTEKKDIENGNKVWIYINEKELKKEWNSRSLLAYDSLDRKNQKLRFTLIRYLTSKGYRKDSAGVSALSKSDIKNIENGITNKLFTEGNPVRSKIYEIIWQIDYYLYGGNPSGHSVTQRVEFYKTGWNIFLRAPIFGVGTGDLKNEYELQYKHDKTILDPEYRILAHNQYLTFLISFGVTGFILICFALFYPAVTANRLKSYNVAVFFIIVFLSMLGEDTLETHTGVSFFAYFYSLYFFGTSEKEP